MLPVGAYLSAVEQIASSHAIARPVVFLSSEDGSAIEMFRQAAASRGIAVVTHEYPRPRFRCGSIDLADLGVNGSGARLAVRGQYAKRSQAAYNDTTLCPHLGAFAREHNVPISKISLLNLFLSLEAGHIVCDVTSNWCRLLFELSDRATLTNVRKVLTSRAPSRNATRHPPRESAR